MPTHRELPPHPNATCFQARVAGRPVRVAHEPIHDWRVCMRCGKTLRGDR